MRQVAASGSKAAEEGTGHPEDAAKVLRRLLLVFAKSGEKIQLLLLFYQGIPSAVLRLCNPSVP